MKPWAWYLLGLLTPCVVDALVLACMWLVGWHRKRQRPEAPSLCEDPYACERSDREAIEHLLRTL